VKDETNQRDKYHKHTVSFVIKHNDKLV